MSTLRLLWCLVVLLTLHVSSSQVRTSNFKMRVVSRRDSTGHWTITTHTNRMITQNKPTDIVLDIQHNVTSIGGVENISLVTSARLGPQTGGGNNHPETSTQRTTETNEISGYEEPTTSAYARFRTTTPMPPDSATHAPWYTTGFLNRVTTGRPEIPSNGSYDISTIPPVGSTAAPPPADYEEFPGVGFYKSTKRFLSWNDANDKCVEDGARLMIIDTDQKIEVFKILYLRQWPKINSEGVHLVNHIGVYDARKDGNFTTVMGDPVDATFWAPGQPEGGDQHCGAARWNGLLHDVQCDMKSAFICEIPFVHEE